MVIGDHHTLSDNFLFISLHFPTLFTHYPLPLNYSNPYFSCFSIYLPLPLCFPSHSLSLFFPLSCFFLRLCLVLFFQSMFSSPSSPISHHHILPLSQTHTYFLSICFSKFTVPFVADYTWQIKLVQTLR